MENIVKIIKYTGLIIVLLYSCRNKVELDELKTVKKQLVIEGILTTELNQNLAEAHNISAEEYKANLNSKVFFKVSETSLFYENKAPKTKDATITVTNKSTGKAHSLKKIQSGVYMQGGNMTKPVVGEEYDIKVQVEGKTITSKLKMPEHIEIESCTFKESEDVSIQIGGNTTTGTTTTIGKQYDILLNTKPLKNNQYIRLDYRLKRNDGYLTLEDGTIFRGGVESLSSVTQATISNVRIRRGDRITVYLHSITSEAYEYYRGLYSITSSGSLGSVGNLVNPKTNWSDTNVLGAMIPNNTSKITYEMKEEGKFTLVKPVK